MLKPKASVMGEMAKMAIALGLAALALGVVGSSMGWASAWPKAVGAGLCLCAGYSAIIAGVAFKMGSQERSSALACSASALLAAVFGLSALAQGSGALGTLSAVALCLAGFCAGAYRVSRRGFGK